MLLRPSIRFDCAHTGLMPMMHMSKAPTAFAPVNKLFFRIICVIFQIRRFVIWRFFAVDRPVALSVFVGEFFLVLYLGYRRDFVVVLQVNQADPLRGAAHYAKLAHRNSDDDARPVDDHQIVVVRHVLDGDQLAGLFGDVDGFYALTATVGHPVIFNVGALAVSFFRHDQHAHVWAINTNHANDLVIGPCKRDAAYAGSSASHRPNGRLVETDGPSGLERHDDFAVAGRQAGFQQLVALIDVNGVDSVCTWARVGFQRGLFNRSLLRAHNDEVALEVLLVLEVLHLDVGLDFLFFRNIDNVLDGPPARGAAAFGDFKGAQPEATASFREEEHVVVRRCNDDVLGEVLFAGIGAQRPFAAPALATVFGQWGTLDVAFVGNRDDNLFVLDEVLDAHVFGRMYDGGAAFVAVFGFHLHQLVLDDFHAQA